MKSEKKLKSEQQVKVKVHMQMKVRFTCWLWSSTYKGERGSQGVGNEQKLVGIGR